MGNKLRKSKRPGKKKSTSCWSVTQMISQVNQCFKMEGEVRQIFIEELNNHFQKWNNERITKQVRKQRYTEVLNYINKLASELKQLKYFPEHAKKAKLIEQKIDFILSLTLQHTGEKIENLTIN